MKQNWEDLKLKEKALEHRKKRVLAGRAAQPAGFGQGLPDRREGCSGRIRLGKAGGRMGKGQGGDGRGTGARSTGATLRARRRSSAICFSRWSMRRVCTESIPRRRSRKATASSSAASRISKTGPSSRAGSHPRHDARADGCAVERGQGDGKGRRRAIAVAPEFFRGGSDNRCWAFQSRFPCVSA